MKLCCVCKTEKPENLFYEKKKGFGELMAACKTCINDRNKRYRHGVGKEKTLAHDRERNKNPERIEKFKERLRVRADKFPERIQAKYKLHNAVRAGKVKPWPVCFVHDCDGKPEAHHPDYSSPLDVVWLCHSHHIMAHKMVNHG